MRLLRFVSVVFLCGILAGCARPYALKRFWLDFEPYDYREHEDAAFKVLDKAARESGYRITVHSNRLYLKKKFPAPEAHGIELGEEETAMTVTMHNRGREGMKLEMAVPEKPKDPVELWILEHQIERGLRKEFGEDKVKRLGE